MGVIKKTPTKTVSKTATVKKSTAPIKSTKAVSKPTKPSAKPQLKPVVSLSKAKEQGGTMGKITATAKSVGASALSSVIGGSKRGGGGRRRRHGPNYWANKVLVEKLKKKYNKLKFGGR